MKLIIAGSRTIDLKIYQLEDFAYYVMGGISLCDVEQLVSGECKYGPDKTCTDLAKKEKRTEKNGGYKGFPAQWDDEEGNFDRAAGHKRNKQMAEYADALLLIWDGSSAGSKNMLSEMKKLKKPVYEVILRKHNV
jgi:hypothetical protein